MQVPDFTVEHLKQLPLRAIVTFAARCARRVESLAQAPEGDPEAQHRGQTVEAALRLAEDFASGSEVPPDPSVVEAIDAIAKTPSRTRGSRRAAAAAAEAARAAALAWSALDTRHLERRGPVFGLPDEASSFVKGIEQVTVELAALTAFTAAVDAYGSVGCDNERFVAAALDDYDTLLKLKLGSYPEPGAPIDPSPSGPLGRL